MRSLHAGASCVLHGSSRSARLQRPRLTGKNLDESFEIATVDHDATCLRRHLQLLGPQHSVAQADSRRDNSGNPVRRIPRPARRSGHDGRNPQNGPRLPPADHERSSSHSAPFERRTGPFWHDTSKRSGAKKLIGSAGCCKRQVEVTAVATRPERSIRSSHPTTTTTRSFP